MPATTPEEQERINGFLKVLRKQLDDHDREHGLKPSGEVTSQGRGQVVRQGQKKIGGGLGKVFAGLSEE